MPSRKENTHKISKQFLLFRVIPIRSRCHYYKRQIQLPSFASALTKCEHLSQLNQPTGSYLYYADSN